MLIIRPNYVPLSPVSFLARSAEVYPTSVAVVDDDGTPVTYRELRHDADVMADLLRELGVRRGDRVAVLSGNTRWLLAAHFGVPGCGAALVALNTRLSAAEYRQQLEHSRSRVFLLDPRLADRLMDPLPAMTRVLDLPGPAGAEPSSFERAVPLTVTRGCEPPEDEQDILAVNYTSGTTAAPKGVTYTHRGAYLNALAVALEFQLRPESTYLWTLPMFHCNGWCFTWAVTALGARHVCLSTFDAERALDLVDRHQVTHLCGAPVVLSQMARAASSTPRQGRLVRAAVGGAPPPPTVVSALAQVQIATTHLYGLTETYGPSLLAEPQAAWQDLDPADRATRIAPAGRAHPGRRRGLRPGSGWHAGAGGRSHGREIAIRSNTVMAGYLDDEAATAEAFRGGWFHTGDLAVVHDDGYLQIVDRSKDVIISGGENISSVEVEAVLCAYPGVLEAAVVAVPDETWGERPVAFVCRNDESVTPEALDAHTRQRLAHFKAPRSYVFGDLPKTSTGKTRKDVLRRQVALERG